MGSFVVLLLLFISSHLAAVTSQDIYGEHPSYGPQDDVSWAIVSPEVSSLLGEHTQELYYDFMNKCEQAVANAEDVDPDLCEKDEQYRMIMNKYQPSGMYNYTKMGFAKIKCPPGLFKILSRFYKRNSGRDKTEWPQLNTYHNLWDTNPTIIHLNKEENLGGGPRLQSVVFNEAKKIMEDWTGQELSPVSLYGVRLYHNGSILAPHVDRTPLVTSAISKFSPNERFKLLSLFQLIWFPLDNPLLHFY